MCKCACLDDDGGGPTLLVGDGASDFCVAGRVELTFAKAALRDHCVDLGLPHRPIANFAEALAAWHELIADAHEAAAPPREEIA